MPDFSIGVDLGGTNLRIAAVTSDGQLLEKVTLGTKTALGPNHVITEMCDAIQRLSAQYRQSGKFLGAGLGIPGIIDLQTGMLRKSANLPGFEEYPVRGRNRAPSGVPEKRGPRSPRKRRQCRRARRTMARRGSRRPQTWPSSPSAPESAVASVLQGKIWHGMKRHGRRVRPRHPSNPAATPAAAVITDAPSNTPQPAP